MKTSVEIIPAQISMRDTLRNLYQLYQYDMSEFNGSRIESSGLFHVTQYLDDYWSDEDRFPYIFRVDSNICGFSLVRRLGIDKYSIAEFFVMRAYRKQGVGNYFACTLFDSFRGNWSVAQEQENVPAQCFWKKVIDAYTQGVYRKSYSESQPAGPQLEFSNV